MSTTYKFKVMVVIKDPHGTSRTIYPIIEVSSDTEARRIAEADYPDGNVRTITKIH